VGNKKYFYLVAASSTFSPAFCTSLPTPLMVLHAVNTNIIEVKNNTEDNFFIKAPEAKKLIRHQSGFTKGALNPIDRKLASTVMCIESWIQFYYIHGAHQAGIGNYFRHQLGLTCSKTVESCMLHGMPHSNKGDSHD
jgi:hypothetical protein